ncbi:MAG: UxaA family hydrolase [Christensenellales bacterium]
MFQAIRIHQNDNTAVIVCSKVLVDQYVTEKNGASVTALEEIQFGHKIALEHILKGERVYKYGYPFGVATQDIKPGQWVHTHNVKTALSGKSQYKYEKAENLVTEESQGFFSGYLRKNGRVGIRNEIWILPMVSCVNHTARMIEAEYKRKRPEAECVNALNQPFGCSQLGDDHEMTVTILRDIATHPNTAGVLLLSLGCENNILDDFLAGIDEKDADRIRYLVTQKSEDEFADACAILDELYELSKTDKRTRQPLSKLFVGFKCGASDGFSGVTANPLAGMVCEKLVKSGAGTVLTETPEMFGAEHLIMNQAKDEAVFEDIVKLINDFKDYYISHNQPIYENPAPGNKEGGITTLEEKSLGCIQKGGHCEVVDVLAYGEKVKSAGLSLLSCPGNDPVSITALASSGCQLLLFTTGRGNPLSSVIPTIKIASNSDMAKRKHNWIDFDAGSLLSDADAKTLSDELFDMVMECANGEYITKSERAGYKEIGIFKDGVTL